MGRQLIDRKPFGFAAIGLSPTSRTSNVFVLWSWGLHPRLYAYACSAGSERKHLPQEFS